MKLLKPERLESFFKDKGKLFALALVGAICITLMCPVKPFTDSSVFRYVAYAMQNGQIPYKDVFDHKGPLIYLINFLGLTIHKTVGIWIFEIATLVLTICYTYKTANLVCKNILNSIATTLVVMSSLPRWFDGGNLTEEYAMPLISVAVFIFTDYFINDKISNLKLFICGLCGGGVLMLRPNMAVAWLVFPIAVIVKELTQKSICRIFRYILWFLCGVAVAIIPFVIYFFSVNALWDFWDSYIQFNMEYSSRSVGIYKIAKCVNYFMVPHIIISLVVSIVLSFSKQYRFLGVVNFAFIGVSLFAVSMSGNSYGHYGMILVPVCTYPFSIVIMLFEKNKTDFWKKASVCAMIAIILIPALSYYLKSLTQNVIQLTNTTQDEVVNYVEDNTEPEDKIIVIGNDDNIYVSSNRLSASKYSYQGQNYVARESILTDFYNDLEKENPKIVIICNEIDGIFDFLEKNGYKSTYSNESYNAYMQVEIGEE